MAYTFIGPDGKEYDADRNPVRRITSEQEAKLAGYTRLVYAECDMHDGVYLVKPDADLDDVVTGWCDDTQKLVRLNGWNWTFTDA